MSDQPRISVVVPVYNEQENLELLADEVLGVGDAAGSLELVFADDGSTDGTWRTIQKVSGDQSLVRGVRSSENRGQSAAMLMGIQASRGEIVVIIDGDLQNNPADIPILVGALDAADVACGCRMNRMDSWARRTGSCLANCIRRWVTRDALRDTGCSLKAFRRECIDDLPPCDGMHRFMGAYFQLNGRTIVEVPVDHRVRRFGSSKYTNLKRLPRTLLDLFGFIWYRKRYRRRLTDKDVESC